MAENIVTTGIMIPVVLQSSEQHNAPTTSQRARASECGRWVEREKGLEPSTICLEGIPLGRTATDTHRHSHHTKPALPHPNAQNPISERTFRDTRRQMGTSAIVIFVVISGEVL